MPACRTAETRRCRSRPTNGRPGTNTGKGCDVLAFHILADARAAVAEPSRVDGRIGQHLPDLGRQN
jgi:hypothetical protein